MTTAATAQKPRASGWTHARRRKHSLAMRRWKPWTRSTGPRTKAGKAAASLNAFRHGGRANPFARYNKLLKDHSALLSNLVSAVKLSRKYHYYALPGCTAALQNLILAKGLDGQKKLKTNELLDLARNHRLMRFPRRWKGPGYADLDRVRRKCEKFREFLSLKG